MSNQINIESLYKSFLNYDYQELEEFVLKANDKIEREFYARLCDFYLSQRQELVMKEFPF